MKGANAEPWLKTIKAPKITRTNSIGNNQYFFLSFKNSKNSFINDMTKIDVSLCRQIDYVLSNKFLFSFHIFYLVNLYQLYS